MLWALRHLLAIGVLPFTMAVAIPVWLARREGIVFQPGPGTIQLFAQALGASLLAIGIVLFLASVRQFATEGRGTLAPWDPPRRLVVRGPYRYVRNPMISGVVFALFGEALLLLSRPHLIWALTFLAINCLYIPLVEEPMLALRFGEDYREYCRQVPRLVPRWRPYDPR
ncbi:MAG TPA: isoprenylcysteine carboxylmethyltransferase family protein [Gemmatimonadales bacterium]|nr:isoprenylcysteine carboxylmethyltransferase family protein [Gemmatimonadales bacterium]